MRVRAAIVLSSMLVAAGGAGAWAQEPGRVGLVAAAPESVGLSFRLTDRVALRADLFQSRSSEGPPEPEGSGVSNTTIESHEVAVAVSALFYIARWDAVRAYVSPRVEYGRHSRELSSSAGSPSQRASSSAHGVAGSIGAEVPRPAATSASSEK